MCIRDRLRGLARRLDGQRARLVEFAEAEPGRGEDDPAEEPAAGVGGRAELERAFGVLGGRPELLQIPVTVPELVGELCLVEERGPVRHVVPGPGRLQGALGPHERRRARPHLAEHAVRPGFGGVQQRLHDRRATGAGALLGDPGQLDGLPAVAEIDGLAAHGDQDVGAVGAVAGRLGEPQGLHEVALGEAVRGDVVRGPAREPGQVGGGAEQPAAGLLVVGAAEHRLALVLQVAHEGLPGVAAAVAVVEGAEQLADRAQRVDVPVGDLVAGAALGVPARAGRQREHRPALRPGRGGTALRGHPGCLLAGHLVVRLADQPVPAGHHEPGRGEGDLAQLGVAAGVLAPQPADDVDGLLGGGGELQPGVHRRARVQAEILGGEPAPEPAGEDLGDEGRGRTARLLPAQPAGDGGLVVSQVQPVLQPELVDATSQTRVGEPRLCDERGELAVGGALRGSVRHLRCGLLPSVPLKCRIAFEQPLWPHERRECSGE